MTDRRASGHRSSRPGRFWPTARQEWLLRAALGSPSAARAEWDQRDLHDWSGTLDEGSRRLLPLVRWNLASVLAPPEMTDPVLERAARVHAETERRNDELLRTAAALVRELRQAGIDVLLLKGAALVLSHYPAPGLRPMVDLDILVARPALADAAALLSRYGWAPKDPLSPGFARTRHAAVFTAGQNRQCDLHWNLFEEHCPPSADAACWTAARTVNLRGTPVRVLAPTDQLLHVVVHGTKWSRTPGVRWVADAMFVLRGGEIDWARLVEQAMARGFVLRLRLGLEYLRAAMAAPIPDATLDRLCACAVPIRERVEYWARSREHRRLGFLPFWGCNYLRSVARPERPTLAGFFRYLAAAWGTESTLALVGGALARSAQRLRKGAARPSHARRTASRGGG